MEEFDAKEITQKILSAVIRTEERFGTSHVSMVLQGKMSEKILARGHDKLTVFGIESDFTDAQLKQVMGLLISNGLLEKSEGEYPTLSVSPAGRNFLEAAGVDHPDQAQEGCRKSCS